MATREIRATRVPASVARALASALLESVRVSPGPPMPLDAPTRPGDP
jgi:hypothetical protein